MSISWNRFNERRGPHLELLATLEGIDADLFMVSLSATGLRRFFPMRNEDILYSDITIDWGKLPANETNLEKFNAPWTITRQLYESSEDPLRSGTWRYSEEEKKFVWVDFGDRFKPLPALPPWSGVVQAARRYFIEQGTFSLVPTDSPTGRMDLLRSQAAIHSDINVGAGISHMSSFIHLAGAVTNAGRTHQRALMRKKGKGIETYWTASKISDFLDELASKRNAAESAYNEIRDFYDIIAQDYEDAHGGLGPDADVDDILDAREKSYLMVRQFIEPERLSRLFQEKIQKLVESENFPTDLPTLKAVLTERLEAVATGHQKRLKGALTQQAIDNWAACDDLDDALKEIAKQCRLGVLEIQAAQDDIWARAGGAWSKITDPAKLPEKEEHSGDDPPAASLGKDGEHYRQNTGIGEAKTAFAAAKRKIEAIVPLNVPLWTVDGTAYQPGTTPSLKSRRVVLKVSNPAGVEGRAIIDTDGIRVVNAKGEEVGPIIIPGRTATTHQVTVVVLPVVGTVTITAEAGNLCGVSKVAVELAAP